MNILLKITTIFTLIVSNNLSAQTLSCEYPEAIYSTKEGPNETKEIKLTSYITPADVDGGMQCSSITPISDKQVMYNGKKTNLQSDSIDFDLTAIRTSDDRIMYKFENIEEADIVITDEKGIVYHNYEQTKERKYFNTVILEDEPDRTYYLSAIVNKTETIQIQILDK